MNIRLIRYHSSHSWQNETKHTKKPSVYAVCTLYCTKYLIFMQ